MKKKHYFLPALHEKNEFISTSTHHVGDPYVDDREKRREMMPDRAFKKDIPQWHYQKSCDGNFFAKAVRQEADVYDKDLAKYMKSTIRGIERPKDFAMRRQSTLPTKEFMTYTG